MATNPVNINIPPGMLGMVSCLCNAGYYQRVTLQWPGNTAVFQGSGEGKQMLTPTGDDHVQLSPSAGAFTLSAKFEFSVSGPAGPFQPAQVQNPNQTGPSPFTVIQVTSEDSGDNDNNDSYLTVMLMPTRALAADAPPLAKAAAFGTAAGLNLHAKTYYNDPAVQGGDEHYVTVPPFSGTTAQVQYSGTSWSMLSGGCYNQATPLGGYLQIQVLLGNCNEPGLVGAQLQLSTVLPYWGTVPSGYKSTDWAAKLLNSSWVVTRVTD